MQPGLRRAGLAGGASARSVPSDRGVGEVARLHKSALLPCHQCSEDRPRVQAGTSSAANAQCNAKKPKAWRGGKRGAWGASGEAPALGVQVVPRAQGRSGPRRFVDVRRWRGHPAGMAGSFLYLTDETGAEIPGTRRAVDYDGDREHYFTLRDELMARAGENCLVRDSALEGEPLGA